MTGPKDVQRKRRLQRRERTQAWLDSGPTTLLLVGTTGHVRVCVVSQRRDRLSPWIRGSGSGSA